MHRTPCTPHTRESLPFLIHSITSLPHLVPYSKSTPHLLTRLGPNAKSQSDLTQNIMSPTSHDNDHQLYSMPLAQPKGWHPFRVLEVALLFCNGKKDRSRVQREKGGKTFKERGGWRRNERMCARTVNTLKHNITKT